MTDKNINENNIEPFELFPHIKKPTVVKSSKPEISETGLGAQTQQLGFDDVLHGTPVAVLETKTVDASSDNESVTDQPVDNPDSEVAGKTHNKKLWFRVLPTWLVVLLVTVFTVGSFGLVYAAFAPKLRYAPEPPGDMTVALNVANRGELGDKPVDTNEGKMTVNNMQPLHYFIPELGVYSKIIPTNKFENTRYGALQGLVIPKNARDTAWYSDGASLVDLPADANISPEQPEPDTGGTADGVGEPVDKTATKTDSSYSGTTLLANHINYANEKGVLDKLGTVKGGELVYVKDKDGNLSVWKIVNLKTRLHTEFPQEYWGKQGARQLVLTTCTDLTKDKNGKWYFKKNVFATAIPAELPEPVAAASSLD